MTEYAEPTNRQLANFLAVYSKSDPLFAQFNVSAEILEHIFETRPDHREGALRLHRKFQDQIKELSEKIEKGELQCEHIRPNGKRCPNHNEPGSHYCGLHKDQEE